MESSTKGNTMTYTLTFTNSTNGFIIEAHEMAHAIEQLNEYRLEGWNLSGVLTATGEQYNID
jgi:hypothetical protein